MISNSKVEGRTGVGQVKVWGKGGEGEGFVVEGAWAVGGSKESTGNDASTRCKLQRFFKRSGYNLRVHQCENVKFPAARLGNGLYQLCYRMKTSQCTD